MNNQGLLALAQLILPSEILSNFEVVRVEEEASFIRIYLDESIKDEYKENPEIESKGFCEAVTIRDFPIRDKGVDLIVRRNPLLQGVCGFFKRSVWRRFLRPPVRLTAIIT